MVLPSPVAQQFQVEDRAQSYGSEISSRTNHYLRATVLAHRMPMPQELTQRMFILLMQGRGVDLSSDEAIDWLRTLAAAELIGAEHAVLTDTQR